LLLLIYFIPLFVDSSKNYSGVEAVSFTSIDYVQHNIFIVLRVGLRACNSLLLLYQEVLSYQLLSKRLRFYVLIVAIHSSQGFYVILGCRSSLSAFCKSTYHRIQS